MAKYKHVWFINFAGIGNGISIVPLLRCFEYSYPLAEYFHSENEILSGQWFIKKARLKNLKGFSPIAWRRFKKEDWEAITAFIQENEIDLIVNLRNEGPKYDTGYFEFKKFLKQQSGVAFWDLDFNVIEKREKQKNLIGDILQLFQRNDIDISSYDSQWLSIPNIDRYGIGFGMAASQKNKRWPTHKWIELAQKILANQDQKIILFPGISQEEVDEAVQIQKMVGADKCDLINHTTLQNIATVFGKLKCFVSNDTGLLHISTATGTKTIGLYTSTDPDIWAPYDKTNFSSLVNVFMERCPARKIYCGNCFHYYDPCPAIVQYGDSINPEQVFGLIKKIIS